MGEPLPRSPGGSVESIRMVTAFYSRMLDSPRLQRHFAGMSMEGLISKQSALIDVIATNGAGYTEDEMHRLHAHLSIDDADYDEMLLLLDLTMREQRTSSELGATVKRVFASFRGAIVKPGRKETRSSK